MTHHFLYPCQENSTSASVVDGKTPHTRGGEQLPPPDILSMLYVVAYGCCFLNVSKTATLYGMPYLTVEPVIPGFSWSSALLTSLCFPKNLFSH